MNAFDVLEIFDWVLSEEQIAADYIREGKHFRIAMKAVTRMHRYLGDISLGRKFEHIEDAFEHLCLTYVRSDKFRKFGVSPSACFSEDTFRRWRDGILYGKISG